MTIKDEGYVKGILARRKSDSHKGDHGRVVIFAGSERYAGAAILAAAGALRAGAGLVTVVSEECVFSPLSARFPEAMRMRRENAALTPLLKSADAVLIGCGLSEYDAKKDIRTAALASSCPMVIDAGGISALPLCIDILRQQQTRVTITPHAGEFAQLAQMSVEEVLLNRVETAEKFAAEYKMTVALKSDRTVIASPDKCFVNTTGNAGLAKGGSGDLLAGIITAFAALYEPFEAAALGVYVHGAAADETAKSMSMHSMLASDVAGHISDALLNIISE